MNPELLHRLSVGLLCVVAATGGLGAVHDGHGSAGPASERDLFARSPFHLAQSIPAAVEHRVPITTKSDAAQQFFDQGMAMLYAGWPQEAERAFLTARKLDEDAAMPRWGIALSHLVREPSGALPALVYFADHADQLAALSPLERELIAALPAVRALETATDWREQMLRRLRQAATEHPSLSEIKAVLAWLLADGLHAWRDAAGESRDATLLLIRQVEKIAPFHPVHRAGLRLWSNELRHDPYHTPKRYFDPETLRLSPVFPTHWNLLARYLAERGEFAAALPRSEMASRIYHRWSANLQHAPDLLPGYARQRRTQGEQFRAVGNAAATLAIAHDLLRLPRHPVWNATANGFGSALEGRQLLLESCFFFGLWDELAEALNDGRIAPLANPVRQAEHAFARGVAAWFRHRSTEFKAAADQLHAIASGVEDRFVADAKPAYDDAHHGSMLQWLRNGGEDYLAVTDWDRGLRALAESDRGNADVAALLIAGSRRIPALLRARLLWAIGRRREAGQALLNADGLALPLRVAAMQQAKTEQLEFPVSFPTREDHSEQQRDGEALSHLGLSQWQPPAFPSVKLPLLDGTVLEDRDLDGRDTLLIFVYSSHCGHCVDQLSVLREHTAAIREARLNVVVVAGQPADSLAAWLNQQAPYPARFVADPDEKLFPQVGAYDDFTEMPLHATLYIDSARRELWKDIGYEPFMDIEFLLTEIRRLRTAYPPSQAD